MQIINSHIPSFEKEKGHALFFCEAYPACILRSNVIEKAQIAFPTTSLRMK
jgi:hypothetical protein